MKKLLNIWLTLFCLLISSGAFASDVGTRFDAANKLYAENKFADAATAYESIIVSGSVSPALHFNLGNARFKAGQLGHAIAAYHRARTFSPRDPDVIANLGFARNQVQGPTIKPSTVTNVFTNLTLNEWTWLATGGIWVLFGLLIARQIKPSLKRVLRNWTFIAAGMALLLGVALLIAYQQNTGNKIAVVIAEDATVRNSPLDQSPSTFVAQDGAELRVLDTKDEWLQVTDGNRRIGWLPKSAVNIIGG